MLAAQGAFQATISLVNGFHLKALRREILTYQAAELHVIINYQNAIHNLIVVPPLLLERG